MTDPNSDLLASDDYNACDASGYYWAHEKTNLEASAGYANNNIDRVGGIINRGNALAFLVIEMKGVPNLRVFGQN